MSYYETEGHPNYTAVPAVKSCKEENENSIHGAELKQNNICGAELKQYSICGAELEQRRQENKMTKDELCASYLTRKTKSKRTKDEFYVYYLKKKMVSSQQGRSIDYYQDEEKEQQYR